VEKSPKKSKQVKKPQQEQKGEKSKTIVVSAFNLDDKEILTKFVKKVKDTNFQSDFDENTTHVLVKPTEEKTPRTMKVLQGIANGLWILDISWLEESVKNGSWVKEDGHETDYFPGASLARKAKAAGKPLLFDGLKFYINRPKVAGQENLFSLLSSAGGKLVDKFSDCDICISGRKMITDSQDKIPIVSEEWVFESLHHYRKQPHQEFVASDD